MKYSYTVNGKPATKRQFKAAFHTMLFMILANVVFKSVVAYFAFILVRWLLSDMDIGDWSTVFAWAAAAYGFWTARITYTVEYN